MNHPRQLPQTDYMKLKAAFRELVKLAGGPNAAAKVTRVSASKISEYGAPHLATQAPIDVVADLEAEVGQPVVTRLLADLQGFDIVPRATAAASGEHFARHLGDVAHALSTVVDVIGNAVADMKVTGEEIAEIQQAAKDAGTELAEVVADCQGGSVTALRQVAS